MGGDDSDGEFPGVKKNKFAVELTPEEKKLPRNKQAEILKEKEKRKKAIILKERERKLKQRNASKSRNGKSKRKKVKGPKKNPQKDAKAQQNPKKDAADANNFRKNLPERRDEAEPFLAINAAGADNHENEVEVAERVDHGPEDDGYDGEVRID